MDAAHRHAKGSRGTARRWVLASFATVCAAITVLAMLLSGHGELAPVDVPSDDRASPRKGPPLAAEARRSVEGEAAREPGRRSVQWLDLGTGGPIADTPIEYQTSHDRGRWLVSASRSDGTIDLPLSGVVRAQSASGWSLSHGPEPVPIPSDGRLWGFRAVKLVGRIRDAASGPGHPAFLSGVNVDLCVTGRPGVDEIGDVPRRPVEPWTQEWVARMGLHGSLATLTDAQGRFELTAPQMLGTSLRARLRGYHTALVPVPVGHPGGALVGEEILLHRAQSVRGVLRAGTEGLPKDVVLRVYYLESVDPATTSLESLRARETGFSYARLADGRAFVQTHARVVVDPMGNFEVQVPHAARILLDARAPGFVPARATFDSIEEAPTNVVLDLGSPPSGASPRVVFRMGGEPLRDQDLLVVDLTDDPVQTSVTCKLDGKGETEGRWLELGRRYAFRVVVRPVSAGRRPVLGRCTLNWDGRSDVVLERRDDPAEDR